MRVGAEDLMMLMFVQQPYIPYVNVIKTCSWTPDVMKIACGSRMSLQPE